jgi:5'-nucleotidase
VGSQVSGRARLHGHLGGAARDFGVRAGRVTTALPALAALLLPLLWPGVAPAISPSPEPVQVRIAALNDLHGALSAGRRVEGRPVGSAGVLAAWLRSEARGREERTLYAVAGDLFGASPPASALLADEPTVAWLDLLGNGSCQLHGEGAGWLDPGCNLVAGLGNHELDHGREELLRLLRGGNNAAGPFLEDPWRGARHPTLAANVVDLATGQPLLPAHVVRRVGGVAIGFIGVVLHEAPSILRREAAAGLAFLDEAEAVRRSVRALQAEGVHAVVVLLHQGGRQRRHPGPTPTAPGGVSGPVVKLVARLDPEVDVVVTGHTHRFTNAFLPAAGGKLVLVTQAYAEGTAYARIDLSIDPRTQDVVGSTAAIQTAWADVGPGRTPDPAAAALQAAAEARVAPLVGEVLGTAAEALTASRGGSGESALGDLVADAQLAAFPDAQAALTNPGGLRAPLPEGPITRGRVLEIQPFANRLVALTLTGAQLRAVLERQWAGRRSPCVLQVSGLSYRWSAAARPGRRVSELRVGGAPLAPAAPCRIVVNEYLAGGGDGFSALARGRDRALGPTDQEALEAWVRSRRGPLGRPAGGRIERVP